jgi:hypothetical protein
MASGDKTKTKEEEKTNENWLSGYVVRVGIHSHFLIPENQHVFVTIRE